MHIMNNLLVVAEAEAEAGAEAVEEVKGRKSAVQGAGLASEVEVEASLVNVQVQWTGI